jgi:MFS family permease
MQGTLARARGALASRDFRFLLGTRLTSTFADGLFQAYLVAQLVFLNPEEQGTALEVAKAYALLVIPFSVVGPLAGVFIDRWPRRGILALTPIVRALATAALIPLSGQSAILYGPVLVVVSLNRFFLSTATAVVPSLVPPADLLMGNSMATVGGTVMMFVGIVVGTKLADPIGTGGLLVLTAALYPVAAFQASRLSRTLRPARLREPVGDELARVARDLWLGARRLAATPGAVGPIASVTLDQFLVGLVTVLSLVVFKEEFGEGVASYGNIVAAGGVGVLLGTATVGLLENALPKPRIVAMAFALAGLVTVALAPAVTGLTILVISFVLGLTFAWRKIPVDTLVQEAVPDRFRGRVFAVYDIFYATARVAAAGLAVVLIPRLSTGWLVAAVGLVYLAWTPVLPAWVRRPQWVGVGFYAGGRADEVPRTIEVAGEEEPVELVRSWAEERDGRRLRRLRVRTADGTSLDLVSDEPGGRWRQERFEPAEGDV